MYFFARFVMNKILIIFICFIEYSISVGKFNYTIVTVKKKIIIIMMRKTVITFFVITDTVVYFLQYRSRRVKHNIINREFSRKPGKYVRPLLWYGQNVERWKKILQHYSVIPFVKCRYWTQHNVFKCSRGLLFAFIKVCFVNVYTCNTPASLSSIIISTIIAIQINLSSTYCAENYIIT